MRPRPFLSRLTDAERAAHLAFVETLGPDAIWGVYIARAEVDYDSVTPAWFSVCSSDARWR